MAHSVLPVRRNILLSLLGEILVLLLTLLLISPFILNFALQITHQLRLNYLILVCRILIRTSLSGVILLGLAYRYLAPVAQLGRLLGQGEEPPPEVAHQAHQVALGAPTYLFVTLLVTTVGMTLLSNLAGLLFIPGYQVVPYFSEALLVITITSSTGIVLALLVRRQLKPVLTTTARLLPSTGPASASAGFLSAPSPERHRFDIRTRLLILILALSFVSYYLPSIVAFNLAYQTTSEPLIRRTLLLLLGFGLITMASTLVSALVMTGDVSGELQHLARRLVEIAQREHQHLNRISTALTSSLDAHEILHMTVQHLVEFSDVDYGSMLILEQDEQQVHVVAEHPSRQLGDLRLSVPQLPVLQQVLASGTPHVIEEPSSHPLLDHLQRTNPSLELCSSLLVPLVARGETIGILLLVSPDQHRRFSEEKLNTFQTIASQAAVAVANARLLQDVQQHRHALTRKSQELAEASSKLDAILNNIADGLVVTDPTGRIILSNPAFREMTGLPPIRPLRGRLLAESFPVAGLRRLASQALETPGQVFTENLDLPDKRVLKVSTTALRIPPPILEPEKGEQIAGVVNVLRDITHEVEVDRMKTNFISAVSHELRSPLTAILGFADLIQRDFQRWITPRTAADEKASQVASRILENLSIIENQSKHLTRIINDVLDIAKIETGQADWPMYSTNLTEVVRRAVAATTPLAEEKGLPIHTHLPPDGLPPVWGHPDRLIQVTTNLLSNAIKFTKRGQVQVSARRLQIPKDRPERPEPSNLQRDPLPPGEWVVVSVTDTGIGIPATEIPRIFEKFTQVGDTLTGKPEGTGLGLSICKGIIEHYSGHIWVESEPDTGSTFSFALPAILTQAEATRRADQAIAE